MKAVETHKILFSLTQIIIMVNLRSTGMMNLLCIGYKKIIIKKRINPKSKKTQKLFEESDYISIREFSLQTFSSLINFLFYL